MPPSLVRKHMELLLENRPWHVLTYSFLTTCRQKAPGVCGAALFMSAGFDSAEGGGVHGSPQRKSVLSADFPSGTAPAGGQLSNTKGRSHC